MLVHIKSIISRANKGGFAVGAFNTSNLEVTLGIIRGAAKKKSPVIVQLSEATIAYAGLSNIFALIKIIAETDGKNIPIAVHLDHGKSQEIIEACVRAGLSSVHRDGSALSFEENIKVTKKAVIFAHRHGVFCQGELGAMLGHEGLTKITVPKNHDLYMTDPKLAAEFVKRTGVDTLAISVGTLHGNFVGKERIDFARLKKIRQAVPHTPLVLHGASGALDVEVRRAIKDGVRLINIDTDLRIAFTKTLKQTIKTADPHHFDPRQLLAPSIEAVAAETIHKIEVFGSGSRR